MSPVTHVDIGAMIFYKPTASGGRACLKNSGISVKCIANWQNMGKCPEEILVKYDHLTLAEVHAALAYYYANKAEIDTDIAADLAADREGSKAARLKQG
jgi:uncharacterized protein (DUF433 family)